MGDQAGGGGKTPVEIEFDSMSKAVSTMRSIAGDIAKLENDFKGFTAGVHADDWSSVPSCRAFGESYRAALAAYGALIGGMHEDLEGYADALAAAQQEYQNTDGNAAAALTKLGQATDGPLQQNTDGTASATDPKRREDLYSADQRQATDTTPGSQDGTTLPADQRHGDTGGGTANGSTGNANGNGTSGAGTNPDRFRQSAPTPTTAAQR